MARDCITASGDSDLKKSREIVIRGKDLRLVQGLKEAEPLRAFTVRRGEHVVITGPNGSGKTTLVKCLLGITLPVKGAIEIFGTAPRLPALRHRVGVLFQNPAKQLFHTTVYDEVAFAARRRFADPERAAGQIEELLQRLELTALQHTSPHTLSYGQKQLVLLAAVAAAGPELLILDDPCAGLDSRKKQCVMALLDHLSLKHRTTIVRTSHDIDPRAGQGTRIVRLQAYTETSAHFSTDLFAKNRNRGRGLWTWPAGAALLVSLLLSMAAFAARSLSALIALTVINLGVILLRSGAPLRLLHRSIKLFLWQAVMICLFYAIRFGWRSGCPEGLQVAWQLFLAFWPGIILMRTTSTEQIARSLGRFMPYHLAFVISTCLRFVPLLIDELKSIRYGQLFRGAGLLRSDLRKPAYWLDWLNCLMVPALVRTLSLSRDIATAAAARDFGLYAKRTYWPGDDESCDDSH